MRNLLLIACLAVSATACASATVEPGHRALMFAPDRGGLQHDVLPPGAYHVASGTKLEDFDVTYAKRLLPVRATTRDGKSLSAKLTVVYRPVMSELYNLENEEGPNYYEAVIAPEVLDAAREVIEESTSEADFARTSKLDASLVAAARKHTSGKHVEIADIVVGDLTLAP